MQSALKVPLQKERHFCLDAARASLLANGLAARQKEAFQASPSNADCSRTHRDVRGPRPSKSRPTSPQPDIHHPTRSVLHPIAPQLEWEGQPKMPRLPSRYASAPRLWPESREGDFQVGNISLVMGWQGSPAPAQISKFSLFKERTRFEPEVSYTPFCR